MGDTLAIVISIGLAAILIFVVPVISMADRIDTISEVDVETKTSEFINQIKNTGKLTNDNYSAYLAELTSNREYI